jgi:hypothetical protein
MHLFSISTFKNEIQISIDFNECANIRDHIHTQCTLALIPGYHFQVRHSFQGVLELNQHITIWILFPYLLF